MQQYKHLKHATTSTKVKSVFLDLYHYNYSKTGIAINGTAAKTDQYPHSNGALTN